jgi:hypothetical protein
VQVTDGNDEVDRICPEISRVIDVLPECPDIGADFRRESRIRDEPEGFALSFRGGNRPCFYDMDTDIRKERCDLEFLVRVQRDPGGLFAVPEGGIKEPDLSGE